MIVRSKSPHFLAPSHNPPPPSVPCPPPPMQPECSHTRTRTRRHTQTRRHTRTRTRPHTRTCTCTRTHAHTLTHLSCHAHAHTHTDTRIHACHVICPVRAHMRRIQSPDKHKSVLLLLLLRLLQFRRQRPRPRWLTVHDCPLFEITNTSLETSCPRRWKYCLATTEQCLCRSRLNCMTDRLLVL